MPFYLQAIQRIPGDTASEKLKWIKRVNLQEQQESDELDRVTSELLPILRLENAAKMKMHEDVTSALRLDDWTLRARALRISWYFDGSHKNVISVEYFQKHVFPYVSLSTRSLLLKTLAIRLIGKDPDFAQQMFKAVATTYGVHMAVILLVACDDDFVYRIVTKNQILLPQKIVKIIFVKNPDLIVRYFRLSKDRSNFSINEYKSFLPRLVKRRLEVFVELYEAYEDNLLDVRLSNSRTAVFLKKGMQYLVRKPRLYIKILSLKMIDAARMASVLPGLLPDDVNLYDTDDIVTNYLTYIPRDKVFNLLRNAYRRRYGSELLDNSENVTPDLLSLLPAEERIKQARIKIEQDKLRDITRDTEDYKNTWICYLPLEESIPVIKTKLGGRTIAGDKHNLVWQLIYACWINKDDDTLCDILSFLKCKFENIFENFLLDEIIDRIVRLYDTAQICEKLYVLLYDITRSCYVKYKWTMEETLVAMIHFRLLRDISIAEPVEILLEMQKSRSIINFNSVLDEHPRHKRRYLAACVGVIQRKYNSTSWEGSKTKFVYSIVAAMYKFNYTYKKSPVRRMTIKDYPWLMDTVRQIIQNPSDKSCLQLIHNCRGLRYILHENERDLYREWYLEQVSAKHLIVTDVLLSGKAFELLKRDPQDILDHWEEYLAACKEQSHCKVVRRFVNATRWYKDIPVKFTERCINDLQRCENVAPSLTILAVLLHGESLAQLLRCLLSRKTTVDAEGRKEYMHLNLPLVAKLCNPPITLDVAVRVWRENYLLGQILLDILSWRISWSKVKSLVHEFAKSEADNNLQFEGIFVLYRAATLRELTDFTLSLWQTLNDKKILQIAMFNKIYNLFRKKPSAISWSLFSALMSTLTLKHEQCISLHLLQTYMVHDTYIVKYFQLLFVTIDNLVSSGLDTDKTVNFVIRLLRKISEKSICNHLPDELIQKIIKKYLFYDNNKLSEETRHFIIHSYLLSAEQNQFESRMKSFTGVFVDEVKNGWNVVHPRNRHFYPIRRTVDKFIRDLVSTYLSTKSKNIQVISAILEIFSSVLTPHMIDRSTYLLLVYTIESIKCKSPKQFGLQLSQKVPKFVEIFSPSIIFIIASTFKSFLILGYTGLGIEEFKFEVMAGLMETDNKESCLVAANILLSVNETNIAFKYDHLIDKFKRMNHPEVDVILRKYLCRVHNNNDINENRRNVIEMNSYFTSLILLAM